ncbi:hypothetical protein FQR65_LT02561 [Abscondita terminalis]|nr:hypothetical protein FQR65_LT02561 [Abscondita terminalis]
MQQCRNVCKITVTKKKKIAVEPGKSVTISVLPTLQARLSTSTAVENFVNFDDDQYEVQPKINKEDEEEVANIEGATQEDWGVQFFVALVGADKLKFSRVMKDLNVLEEVQEVEDIMEVMNVNRHPKLYMEHINTLDKYDDNQFRNRYLLRKENVRYVIGLIRD